MYNTLESIVGRSQKIYYFWFVILILSMLNNQIIKSISSLLYLVEIVYIFYCFYVVKKYYNGRIRWNLILLVFILLVNILYFHNSSSISFFLKAIGCIVSCLLGLTLAQHRIILKLKSFLLFSLTIFPLLLVVFLDRTPKQSLFFPQSNTLVFYGACSTLIYYTNKSIYSQKHFLTTFLLLICYIIFGSTLGIVVALLLTILIINRKKIKLIFISVLFLFLFVLLVFYSNIEIFLRIRNALYVLSYMSLEDWVNIENLNLYSISQNAKFEGNGRTDTTSFLFRFQHWIILFKRFIENIKYSFFIGLGEGYTKKELMLKPHNDYLRILCEFGFVFFSIVFFYLKHFISSISRNKIFYFFLPILIYFFTENLIDYFPANCILFFYMGYWYIFAKRQMQYIQK